MVAVLLRPDIRGLRLVLGPFLTPAAAAGALAAPPPGPALLVPVAARAAMALQRWLARHVPRQGALRLRR